MKVLVTGGNGIIEMAVVGALLGRGHTVRFVGSAAAEATRLPASVDFRSGGVSGGEILAGVADSCDAIVQAADFVESGEPAGTERDGTTAGTRRLLEEAQRAGVQRYILLSVLAAQDGASEFHRGKRQAEALVRESPLAWTICRVAPVYGPGDRTVTALLKALRSLPVVPVVEDHELQPLWAEDLGEAVARLLERDDLARQTLELAGPEPVKLGEVMRELASLAGKSPRFVPLPSWLTNAGLKAADSAGLASLIDSSALAALLDHAAIPKGRSNALVGALGITALPLAEGLRRIVDEVPEASAGRGAGPLWRGRYRADITGCECGPDNLFNTIRDEFGTLMPQKSWTPAEPGRMGIAEGDVISVPLPLRGDAQFRVEEIRPLRITCVTLEDQPFSGALRLLVEQRGELVRFEVQTYERAANLPELLALAAGGSTFKQKAWSDLVERVVMRSAGAAAGGIQVEQEALPPEQVDLVEEWVDEVIAKRHVTPSPHRSKTRSPKPKRDYSTRKATEV